MKKPYKHRSDRSNQEKEPNMDIEGSLSNSSTETNYDKESALVEYQAAQESAHHHDNMLWATTNFMWTGSLILLGLILTQINEPSIRPLIILLGLLGIMLSVYVWVIALQFNSIKNQKYQRCKKIEAIYNLKQHTTLRYAKRSQRVIYAVIMTIFIISWTFVIWKVW